MNRVPRLFYKFFILDILQFENNRFDFCKNSSAVAKANNFISMEFFFVQFQEEQSF